MSNLFCRNPNASEFRGAAYEISAVKCFLHLICQNFRKFATVCPRFATICHYMLPRRDLSSDLFAPIVQKVLDNCRSTTV